MPHPRSNTRKAPLEPLALVWVSVVIVHLLTGLIIWRLLPLWPAASLKPVFSSWKWGEDSHYWFSPAEFHVAGDESPVTPPVPAPGVPEVPQTVASPKPNQSSEESGLLADTSVLKSPMTVASSAPLSEPRSTNKVITLSPVLDEVSGKTEKQVNPVRPALTLMEVLKQEEHEDKMREATGGVSMDTVLKALEEALKKAWNAPAIQEVPVLQRDASLAVSLGRTGEVLEVRMAKHSGSQLLDQSVLDAGLRVKKISESLPSSFPKDRYNVEVNFHIE